MEGLPSLIKPTDTYPFLLVHVGTKDTAKRSYQEITSDFEALGRKLKDFGTQIAFSFSYQCSEEELKEKGRSSG